jgi:twitching motility protein PilT
LETLQELIAFAIDKGASDLHLSAGAPPCIRVNGDILRVGDELCTPNGIRAICVDILDDVHSNQLTNDGETDFAYSIPALGRFRVNIFRQRGSLALALRFLNLTIPRPQDLGLPDAVVEMTDKRRGLILVTGATGSGKSTTLASLIDVINHRHPYHIITLEDPIEYLHRHGTSIVNQREIGSDSMSYAHALRAALRQDPDVILVGEMRDLETIQIAVTAAETGHLVFSTLHTVGAANTVDRIIDVFPPYQQQQIRTQLADVLQCVVSQQLIPKMSGKGRVAAMEVMISNNAIRNHIRESKTFQIPTVMQTNGKFGMKTMDDALFELYQRGEISQENALFYAQDRTVLSKRMV